jgi:hypothetical protein
LIGEGEIKRKKVRLLAKHLNLRGGVTLLDSLQVQDVTTLLADELERIDGQP